MSRRYFRYDLDNEFDPFEEMIHKEQRRYQAELDQYYNYFIGGKWGVRYRLYKPWYLCAFMCTCTFPEKPSSSKKMIFELDSN